MRLLNSYFFVVLIVIISLANSATAQSYSYPELNVVPRATDRLEMESKWESSHRYSVHLGVQVSALSTLAAGLMAEVDTSKDEDEKSPKLAVAFGGAWLGITFLMSQYHRPYAAAIRDVNKVQGNGQREQLTRERLAEEHINAAASLGKKIKWISFITNFASSAYLASNSESESNGSYMAGVAAILSFTPFMFDYKWERVATEQEKYKKKIFAPVASSTILYNPFSQSAVPGFAISAQF